MKELNLNVINVNMYISIRSINNLSRCMYIASTWCVLPLQSYRDITSILFCRLINVDILLLFLTIFIRYKTKMHVNRHIVDAIYIHLYAAALQWYNICIVLQNYQCRYFIDCFNNTLLFFVLFTCPVFLSAGLAAFTWNQAWHSSEVIGA